MEFVIVIGVIVLLIIYLLAQDSRKETKKERYGEAVGELSQMVANKISSTAYSVTEPADKKKLRLAKEELASRHGSLYRSTDYSDKMHKEKLLTIDNSFKNALGVIGISEERWNKLALMIYYLGTIRKLSRDSSDYSKKLPRYHREYMLSIWSADDFFKNYIETLIEALNFFNIKVEEWLEYGDAVIEMHDLYNNPDMEEFGFITSIMPLENNLHKL